MKKSADTHPSSANGPASDETCNATTGNRTTRSTGQPPRDGVDRSTVSVSQGGKGKKSGTKKTLWVTVFRCFHCNRPGHKLPKCTQCGQAYYCNADHQRKHWRKHRPVCRAAVAALARRATRERLARAVREKGKANVKGAEEDDLCVICLAKPVDPVEVGRNIQQ